MSADMTRVMTWHNGDKTPGPFTATEMDARQRKLREHIAAEDLDAVVLTSHHNICYFSGFMYCAFGRKYGFVVTPDNATSVSAGIDGGQPWRLTHGDNITYTDWRKDNFYYALKTLIANAKRIGIEFDEVSIEFLEKLKAAFPDAHFFDVGSPTMWMRTIKSAEEIAHIKKLTAIADIGGEACRQTIGVGVPEHEVALASTQAMVREIADAYDYTELQDTWTWFQSGVNTDGAHNPVTNRVIERGDILSLNCFPMLFGYYVALERTLFAESVSDEHLRMWNVNVEVHEAGLELIKPGAKCSDIASTLNDIYREYNLLNYRSFGYGHSFGVLCHYYGREAGVELREDIDTELRPGMVVSMEPMIMIPEGQPGAGGYREHDILVINHDGTVENITGFPYGPEHNVVVSTSG